ncbi:MAG TPA: DUF1254 domain-containing protein [Armatimonadota bacterium]|nr:DUF1254 domain-containing protein [Armatimonadota bacterium]
MFAQRPCNVTPAEARQIAQDAYIYGYPLVTMEMTRRVMTNVVAATGTKGPMGQFVNMREYPTAAFRDITAPNADTLYSVAWLDLTREPYVLSLPDMHGRYFLMPMLSGWTDVFQAPGKRTTGTAPQVYLITGPSWHGRVPRGMKQLASPTNLVWILGRTYSTGTPEDYAAVHALQDQYRLVPLSGYGHPYTPQPGHVNPNIDIKTPVRDQVNDISTANYFNLLASLMVQNPPTAADAPIVARMARIGIVPGKPFNIDQCGAQVAAALQGVPQAAIEQIMAEEKTVGRTINGWLYMPKTGSYGTNYRFRAYVALIGLGANLPQDAIYPFTSVDSTGQPLSGINRYVIHFPKGQTPPVNGFWSITMYDPEYYFVANPLKKYTVSPRNTLVYNPDGSLDIYIQHQSPGTAKEANWLPAPTGNFILMMRMYWPRTQSPSILNGTWSPPSVEKVG